MKAFDYKKDSPPYVLEFINYLSVIKGRSENTTLSYYWDIKLYIRWLKQRDGLSELPFEEISIADYPETRFKATKLTDVMEFLHYMSNERGNTATARARRAVALRRFYRYLTDNKQWWDKSPLYNLELPGPSKTLPKHLSEQQATTLITISSTGDSFEDIRDECIFTLFLNCGMRLSELTNINMVDIRRSDDNTYYSLKVRGKGSKERMIYFTPACEASYLKYLKARQAFVENDPALFKNPALFVTRKRARLTPRCIEYRVEALLKKIGLGGQGLSPHKLRHTAAALMYQNGADVRVLKDVLGHENLNTTQIYTHVADWQIRAAMEKNPLGNAPTSPTEPNTSQE
jgi:site-specific recombinase XerD